MNDNRHNMIDVVRPPTRPVINIPPPPPPPPAPPGYARASVVPNARPARSPLHKRAWALIRRHPWLAGIAAFFVVGNIITGVAPALGTFFSHHPAWKIQALIIACFWLLAVGTIPVVAMLRTAGNLARKSVDALDGND